MTLELGLGERGRHVEGPVEEHAGRNVAKELLDRIDADRPEAFASVVSDFLERHEQFVVTRSSSLIDP